MPFLDLTMLVLSPGGRERTPEEFQQLLASAGVRVNAYRTNGWADRHRRGAETLSSDIPSTYLLSNKNHAEQKLELTIIWSYSTLTLDKIRTLASVRTLPQHKQITPVMCTPP